jgi:hypothetical protein
VKRPLAYAVIALIPLIAVWAIALIYNPTRIVPETRVSAPKWVEEGPYGTYGTCNDAITGTPVTNQSPFIDSDRAARIGAGVVQSQTDLHTLLRRPIGDFTPVLVERQFPDNQSHLTWVYGEGRRMGDTGLEARAEIVYLDAATGDPLLLIKDIVIYDAGFTCPQINAFDNAHFAKIARQIVVQAVAIVITAIYAIVGIIIYIRSYHRRRAPINTPVL